MNATPEKHPWPGRKDLPHKTIGRMLVTKRTLTPWQLGYMSHTDPSIENPFSYGSEDWYGFVNGSEAAFNESTNAELF